MAAAHEELGCQHDHTVQRLNEVTQKFTASEMQLSEDVMNLRKKTQTLSDGLSEAQAQLKEFFEFQRVLREDVNGQRETLDQVCSRQAELDRRLTVLLKNTSDLEASVGSLGDELH